MRVALLVGFLMLDLGFALYDAGWYGSVGETEDAGQVRAMDDTWPPPPPPPSYP